MNLAKNNQWKSMVETNTSNHDLMDFFKKTWVVGDESWYIHKQMYASLFGPET